MLFTPFRTRATHVVEFRPIGIKNRLLHSAPNLDRRNQTGHRQGDVNGRLGRWENRDCGAAPHLLSLLAGYTPVDYDCGPGCAMEDCKTSTDRSVEPRLPISNATS